MSFNKVYANNCTADCYGIKAGFRGSILILVRYFHLIILVLPDTFCHKMRMCILCLTPFNCISLLSHLSPFLSLLPPPAAAIKILWRRVGICLGLIGFFSMEWYFGRLLVDTSRLTHPWQNPPQKIYLYSPHSFSLKSADIDNFDSRLLLPLPKIVIHC